MAVITLQPFEPLALVGLSFTTAQGGPDGLADYEQLIYTGGRLPVTAGAPAHPLDLASAARQALLDAGIDPARPGLRVAAFSAGAGRVNGPWGTAADLSGAPDPLAALLAEAQTRLAGRSADVVVFTAAAEGFAWPEAVPLAPPEGCGLGFDRSVHGWRPGSGAGAVALMRLDEAQAAGRVVYAVIRSLAYAPGGPLTDLPTPPALDELRGCAVSALAAAGVQPGQVGYVEAFASGVDALDGVEIAGLAQAYRPGGPDLTTAIGSAQANLGYLGAAAGLAGLIRAALTLRGRMIPGAAGWTAPKLPALWRGAPFYIPEARRAWFARAGGPGRLAGLSLIGRGGSCAHLILAEAAQPPAQLGARPRGADGFYLFPLAAADGAGLADRLAGLRRDLAAEPDLARLAAAAAETAQTALDAPLALAIVGHQRAEIEREIDLALQALPAALEKSADWQTPLGSYFTAQPVGRQGGVALVYPGAFNSYPGVGQDLFHLFPDLFDRMAPVTGDLGGVTRERLLYPRSLTAISKEALAAVEADLLADPIAMLISGAALAILYTHILRETFGVRPQASFGYSLGENAMLFAAGVWGQGDAASARLEASDVFTLRLAGPRLAIREHWGLPPAAADAGEPLWRNELVMASPEVVQAALVSEPRAYLTHINTPRQVVIGGDPAACARVLAAVRAVERASSLQAPFDYALHCAVMRSEFGPLAGLHHWPVEQIPDLTMYSAADYAPLVIDRAPDASDRIASTIAQMLTTPLDFPRLVRRVYADGARVFIEAGAGGNCARWIDETLKGSPHLALSLNRRGSDDFSTLVRALARLHSHRVPLNLAALAPTLKESVQL